MLITVITMGIAEFCCGLSQSHTKMGDMDLDYLLMGADSAAQVAVRFLSLEHVLRESLVLHKNLTGALQDVYVRFVLSSVLLGSRMEDQDAILFKLKIEDQGIQINCEVSPKGLLRSAVFPAENVPLYTGDLAGVLQVVRLKSNSDVYQSLTRLQGSSVVDVFRDYLEKSDQSQSIVHVHTDMNDLSQSYGLWIEKLPGTSDEDWQEWQKRFANDAEFVNVVQATRDPDQIVQKLFPEKLTIMAVTKPKLACTCSGEKITQALMVLPKEDLLDIFIKGEGVDTSCDYCGKVWHTADALIKEMVGAHNTVQ